MQFLKILAACAVLGVCADQASAVPYASKIRVSSNNFSNPLTITYRLNEAADSVSIQIMNGVTPVATFAGTTAQGENSVNWNGTADNGAGAAVGIGSYTVKITANKNVAGSNWVEVTSQRSGNPGYGPVGATFETVFDGFSPNDHIFVKDTTSDHFGLSFAHGAYNAATSRYAAAVTFNSDLSTFDGTDGYASRIFKVQALEGSTDAINQSHMWMGSVDPDNSSVYYYTGQRPSGATAFMAGNLDTPEFMVDHNDPRVVTNLPRHVVIAKEGTDKYAYFVRDNSTIMKVAMDANNKLTGSVNVITAFTDTNRYGKQLQFDAAGNLYFISKHLTTAAGTGGMILRWNASQLTGATPSQLLSEDNAVWKITHDGTVGNVMGMAITPAGDCYALLGTSYDIGGRGVYHIGNTSAASLTKEIGFADRRVNLTEVGTTNIDWNLSTIYATIASDPAGNILVVDRTQEQIRLFGPPGNSSTAISAPTSQFISIGGSSVDTWGLY